MATLASPTEAAPLNGPLRSLLFRKPEWLVLLFALAIFGVGIAAPPYLMDDVDSVQAIIARDMLRSGDWITPQINGIPYLEKPPLKYWLMGVSFGVFGVHDWSGRIPVALAAILLCFATARIARWAFDAEVALYSGLVITTCAGLFLFTRVMISDGMLTLAILLALASFLRMMEPEESNPRAWAMMMGLFLGIGTLIKGLLAFAVPAGAIFFYLLATRQIFRLAIWKRLHLPECTGIAFIVAAPWHALAMAANPPLFDFTLRAAPGEYRGFFWFYFLNEHLLRFLNLRYPRDYNTVPRVQFWLYHLLWVFPWTAYLPAAARLHFNDANRASRTRLLCLCVIAFVLFFFTLSTTQEYYTMPAYPAFAILVGCAMARREAKAQWQWNRLARQATGAIFAIALAAIIFLLVRVWNVPTQGDISSALTSNPEAYTLALGHLEDLTLDAFAFLKLPLLLAGVATLAGAVGSFLFKSYRSALLVAAAMVMFFSAARLALTVFDPYLSTRALAVAYDAAPHGELIFDDQFYAFSSVAFYADERVLLLNGRVNNLEYGSHAPGAPNVFLTDAEFVNRWRSGQRHYLVAAAPRMAAIEALIGKRQLHEIAESGGKFLFSNLPLQAGPRGGTAR
ncbi:MAG: glycosyltransferase family 39 protein [Bryobacterales bacterium]|nr:glycosyltransferase family 39 protein [Bryobacterales bacterium]